MQKDGIEFFIKKIPKAELHVHIEGTLEPELLFKFAQRNHVNIKHKSIAELKSAYCFTNLQSFLDIYYEGADVLLKKEDYYELTMAYLEKLYKENVVHTEIFFDPQTHTSRGVPFSTVVSGISDALSDGRKKFGISSFLIMCFLRHLSADSAMETLLESLKYQDKIIGVGLDSTELGNPPSKFKKVFEKAKSCGYLTVAHAGEEGPPHYIWEALEHLAVSRIDHGVRCVEDKLLVKELKEREIPLTVCPLSNIKLAVFKRIEDHNILQLLDLGLNVTINSDDPAYFGGGVVENLLAIQRAHKIDKSQVYTLAKNSFQSTFVTKAEKQQLISKLDKFYLT